MSTHHEPTHQNSAAHHDPTRHGSMVSPPPPSKSSGDGGWGGFIVAILGYLFLSMRQPLDWGMPLWGFLAFLLIPGLAGLVVGRAQRGAGTPGRSFWAGLKAAGKAIALYTICHLLLLGGPHSDSANRGQEWIAGLLTTLLFTLIAGLVAGAVSATVSSIGLKERQI